MPLRIALTIGGLCMMIPGNITDIVGLAAVAAVIVYQRTLARKTA